MWYGLTVGPPTWPLGAAAGVLDIAPGSEKE